MTATITDQEKKETLAKNILAREREIYHYQVNIDNYTAMLTALPSEWPDELAQYKGLDTGQIADRVPHDLIVEVSDLVFYDQVSRLLKTEMIEQSKASRIYDALVSQIEPSELADLLAAALAAQSA